MVVMIDSHFWFELLGTETDFLHPVLKKSGMRPFCPNGLHHLKDPKQMLKQCLDYFWNQHQDVHVGPLPIHGQRLS